MSTGGPDPNRNPPPDKDMVRGHVGNPAGSRLGMGSTAVAILVALIAVAFILQAIF